MLRVHTDVFMKVYGYSINSVTTMVVTLGATQSKIAGSNEPGEDYPSEYTTVHHKPITVGETCLVSTTGVPVMGTQMLSLARELPRNTNSVGSAPLY